MAPFTAVVTGQSLIHHDIRETSDKGFQDIVRLLQQADVAFTNFETTVFGRHRGWPMKESYFGCSAPVVLDALKHIGFNALSLANNHAFDLGPNGILSTIEEMEVRGFLCAGIGTDRIAAMRASTKMIGSRQVALVAMDGGPGPAIMYADNASARRPSRPGVNRLEVARVFEVDPAKFAMLEEIQSTFQSVELERANYCQPHDPPVLRDPRDIDFYGTVFRRSDRNHRRILVDEASAAMQLAAIDEAAGRGDFVIAYLHHHHWEPDWRDVPEWVRAFARQCIDAGARLFVSHGAPVLQPIEIYRSAPLFFGLGNFLFHLEEGEAEWSSPEVWKSVVARCTFDDAGALASLALFPVVLGGEASLATHDFHKRRVPMPAGDDMARSILTDLARRSQAYGTRIEAGRLVL